MIDRLPTPLALALAACITGAFLGIAALALAYLFDWRKPWAYGALALVLGGALTWITLLRWWQDLINAIHGITHQPQPEPLQLQVLYRDDPYLQGDYLDLPITQEQLLEIVDRLTSGGSFSHASLAGPGKPLSRADYERLRDLWISRGLVRWTSPRTHFQGLQLTAKGRAIVRGFASQTYTPGLTDRSSNRKN